MPVHERDSADGTDAAQVGHRFREDPTPERSPEPEPPGRRFREPPASIRSSVAPRHHFREPVDGLDADGTGSDLDGIDRGADADATVAVPQAGSPASAHDPAASDRPVPAQDQPASGPAWPEFDRRVGDRRLARDDAEASDGRDAGQGGAPELAGEQPGRSAGGSPFAPRASEPLAPGELSRSHEGWPAAEPDANALPRREWPEAAERPGLLHGAWDAPPAPPSSPWGAPPVPGWSHGGGDDGLASPQPFDDFGRGRERTTDDTPPNASFGTPAGAVGTSPRGADGLLPPPPPVEDLPVQPVEVDHYDVEPLEDAHVEVEPAGMIGDDHPSRGPAGQQDDERYDHDWASWLATGAVPVVPMDDERAPAAGDPGTADPPAARPSPTAAPMVDWLDADPGEAWRWSAATGRMTNAPVDAAQPEPADPWAELEEPGAGPERRAEQQRPGTADEQWQREPMGFGDLEAAPPSEPVDHDPWAAFAPQEPPRLDVPEEAQPRPSAAGPWAERDEPWGAAPEVPSGSTDGWAAYDVAGPSVHEASRSDGAVDDPWAAFGADEPSQLPGADAASHQPLDASPWAGAADDEDWMRAAADPWIEGREAPRGPVADPWAGPEQAPMGQTIAGWDQPAASDPWTTGPAEGGASEREVAGTDEWGAWRGIDEGYAPGAGVDGGAPGATDGEPIADDDDDDGNWWFSQSEPVQVAPPRGAEDLQRDRDRWFDDAAAQGGAGGSDEWSLDGEDEDSWRRQARTQLREPAPRGASGRSGQPGRGRPGQRGAGPQRRPAPRRPQQQNLVLPQFLQDRNKLMVVIAAIVVIAFLSVIFRGIFNRVAAVDSPQGAPASCVTARAVEGTKAASLQTKFAAPPVGWSVVADDQAGGGLVDFSVALRAEPDASTALTALDSTRFQNGWTRQYQGPKGASARATTYQFAANACAAQYLANHAAPPGSAAFEVPGIVGAKGWTQGVGSSATYSVMVARGNRTIKVAWTGDAVPAHAIAGLLDLAAAQVAAVGGPPPAA